MYQSRRPFVPAAGHDLLLPLYDPLVRLLGADAARRELIERAGIADGQRVLDVGCGTGTLAVQLKRLHPGAEVVGLDPDPRALARAERKARRARVAVRLDAGYADALPYPDASFDRVLSSLVLHHLPEDRKGPALREARRVLAPGGALYVMDFGGGEHRHDGLLARMLHSSEGLGGHYDGGLVAMIGRAGFREAREIGSRTTVLGRVGVYRGLA